MSYLNFVHFHSFKDICLEVIFYLQEGWIGSLRVLAVYLAGVLAGSLGTSLTDPNTYVAGASGGVYSLIAAHLATVLINWSEDNTVKIRKVKPVKYLSNNFTLNICQVLEPIIDEILLYYTQRDAKIHLPRSCAAHWVEKSYQACNYVIITP